MLNEQKIEQLNKIFKEVVSKDIITSKFGLQHHFWKGQFVSRFGPSLSHWDLRIDTGAPGLLHFVMEYNPLETDKISAYIKPCKDKSWLLKGKKIEYLKPGTPENPTKNTPAWIQLLDSGEVIILENKDQFKKFEFKGKKLKGLWIARRESPKSEWWEISRSELPKAKT